MYADREGHGHRSRRQRSSSYAEGSLCDCPEGTSSSRSSRDSTRHGGRVGYGREGRVRLDDPTMLYRRRGTSGGIMDGIINNSGGPGYGGYPRSPMMGGFGPPRGPPVMSPRIDPRMPYYGSDPYGGRSPLMLNSAMGPSGRAPQNGFMGGRGALMSGALPAPPMPHTGPRSPLRPPNSSDIFNPYQMDRPRMPYGPAAMSPMRTSSNYRSPYVEDYESEIVSDLMDQAMMQMGAAEFYGMGEGMGARSYYEDCYMYGSEMGGLDGPQFYDGGVGHRRDL
ncbi:hypothetical protein G7Y89_g8222 [Cudoniella acicularis]|uniref:Uncharacterized protein n=1 Tax=Cudoniella acicularis TaxID=354080 RepID=A0A8H4RHV2_9HELO|nr:hypothetical protein G7Y89_g8222 [Cudoniella acicularis]